MRGLHYSAKPKYISRLCPEFLQYPLPAPLILSLIDPQEYSENFYSPCLEEHDRGLHPIFQIAVGRQTGYLRGSNLSCGRCLYRYRVSRERMRTARRPAVFEE